MLIQFLSIVMVTVSSGFLVSTNSNQTQSVSLVTLVNSLLNFTQVLEANVQTLQNELQTQNFKREQLEKEVESKNDLTFFLRSDIINLNSSLYNEVNQRKKLQEKLATLSVLQTKAVAMQIKLQEDLALSKNQSRSLENKVTDLKKQLQDLERKQSNDSAVCVARMNDLDQLLGTTVVNVTALQVNTKGDPVYFTYRNSDTRIPDRQSLPLKFKVEVSNTGSAFDRASGIFRASKPGVYVFTLTLGASTKNYVTCYITRNDHDYLTEVFTSVLYGYASASSSAVVHIDAGDRVMVSGCHGNGTISSYKSSFSGILIDAD